MKLASIVVVFASVLGCGWFEGIAEAGLICMDEQDLADSVKALEALATNPKSKIFNDADRLCLTIIATTDEPNQLRPRVLAACATTLERDPGDALCVELGVLLGKKQIGTVVLFDVVASWKINVWNWAGGDLVVNLIEKLGDPRGAPIVVDVWKASIAEAEKREKKKWGSAMMAWAGWRKDAAAALGAIGGVTERAFLDEQSKATKDRYVRAACLDAIAVLDKRLAKP